MRAEILTTDSSFIELRAAWNRLAAGDPLASCEWRAAWHRIMAADRPLCVGVVRDGEHVVALLPGFVESHPWSGRKLSLLGNGKTCTDYQRILLDANLSDDEQTAVLDALLDRVLDRNHNLGAFDQIELDGADLRDESVRLLQQALERRGFTCHAEPIESSWITHLPGDWDSFVAGVPRSQRRKVNKAIKRMQSGDVTYHEAIDVESIGAIWPEFVRLHELRFVKKLGGGCFTDPVFEEFLKTAVLDLAARGAAKIVWVEHLGKPISSQLYLLSPTTAHMYQSGVDPEYMHLEPGHLLFTEVLRRLIADGYRHLDFLRGDEAYKGGWNAQAVPLTRLIAVAPRTTSQWRYGSRCWARRLKRNAKSWLKGGTLATAAGAPSPSPPADATEPETVST